MTTDISHLTCTRLVKICCSHHPQLVTSWSALMGWPRMSSAPSARPLTFASSSTCSVPQANCPPHTTGEVFLTHVTLTKVQSTNASTHTQMQYFFSQNGKGLTRPSLPLIVMTSPSWGKNKLTTDSIEFHYQNISLRVLNMEELTWTEEEEESAEHPYYNNIPGKMPPPGGFIDTRLINQNAAPDGCQVPLNLCRLISGS